MDRGCMEGTDEDTDGGRDLCISEPGVCFFNIFCLYHCVPQAGLFLLASLVKPPFHQGDRYMPGIDETGYDTQYLAGYYFTSETGNFF